MITKWVMNKEQIDLLVIASRKAAEAIEFATMAYAMQSEVLNPVHAASAYSYVAEVIHSHAGKLMQSDKKELFENNGFKLQ